jgi:hypothetical protein
LIVVKASPLPLVSFIEVVKLSDGSSIDEALWLALRAVLSLSFTRPELVISSLSLGKGPREIYSTSFLRLSRAKVFVELLA